MVRSRITRVVPALILWLAGCGGSTPRRLLSMTITPENVSSTSASSGVQFSVVGTYNTDPKVQVPPAVAWELFAGLLPKPDGVTVDQNGFAKCQGFVGTAPLVAMAPFDPRIGLSQVRIGQQTDTTLYLQVVARLTCS